MNPGQFNFDVGFNTNLEQFILSLPNNFQVNPGSNAPGFACNVQTYPPGSTPNNALVCNGPVQAMGNHQGQLNAPPNLPQGTKLYGAGGGTVYGPFNMNGP